MAIPDFQEFINSIDAKTISGIMKDANNAMGLVPEQDINHENIPGLQLLSASYLVSPELLVVYHKWLERYL